MEPQSKRALAQASKMTASERVPASARETTRETTRRAERRARNAARPLIGVTGPDRGGWPAWIFTRLALQRAGALPIRLTPSRKFDPALLDGLVLGGGADVSDPLPEAPLEPPPPPSRVRWPRRILDLIFAPLVLLVRLIAATKRHGKDPARDQLELKLLEHAREHDLPLLGICRGAQLMNLAEGGTLLHDVNTLYHERPQLYTVLPRREVQVSVDSRLAAIVERPSLLVNSLHFHAVREPGRGLRIVAREPAGVPQAIEHVTRTFWVGVQWHPEYLPQQQAHQRLFIALTEAARERAQSAEASFGAAANSEQRA